METFGDFAGVIVPAEAAELNWHFCEGACATERSTFGNMLDDQKNFYVGEKLRPCSVCRKTGFDKESNTCPRCLGSCYISDQPPGYRTRGGLVLSTSRCKVCKGSGERVAASGIKECSFCGGEGFEEHQVAMPKAIAREEGSIMPSDETLRKIARVSRRLRAMSSVRVRHLEAYYGPRGDVWGSTLGANRLWSLIPHTAAGKVLIIRLVVAQKVRDASKIEHPDRMLQTCVGRKDLSPRIARSLLEATLQASTLLNEAGAEWNSTRPKRKVA